MNHLDEEQLVMLFYGESEDAAAAREHLADCHECRESLARIERVLETVDAHWTVPETPADYGTIVYRRVTARVEQSGARAFPARWLSLVQPRRWAVAAALAVVVSGAFLAGRFGAQAPQQVASEQPAAVRERVLLVAVGDHLERSQMMLVELANAAPGARGAVDVSYEKQSAGDLLESNRLFRQTALAAGETGVASVLDDLERLLLDVRHGPSSLTPAQWNELRHRIEDQGLLFKVRIIGEQVRGREEAPVPSNQKGTKS